MSEHMGLFISENNVSIKKTTSIKQKAANCGERHILRSKMKSLCFSLHVPTIFLIFTKTLKSE
jgi:hypothetical protein